MRPRIRFHVPVGTAFAVLEFHTVDLARLGSRWIRWCDTGAIVDTWHSGPSVWTAQIGTPYKKLVADYGRITKVADPRTGLVTVIASGIAGFGTIAAGEFLTDPSYLNSFASHAPAGWLRKNMQIVIATALEKGQPGPPRAIAAYFW